MTTHHIPADLLEDYARGAIEPGVAALCAYAGGAMLAEAAPAELSEDALARTLARLDAAEQEQPPAFRPPAYLERFAIPAVLRRHRIGRRLWLAPGIWAAAVEAGAARSSRTYLVYADRNTELPRHTHSGREWTAILSGAFRDDLGRFGPGDFIETDETVRHAPAVTADADCLCLIQSEGPMKLEGIAARAIQLLSGFLY